MSGNSKQPPVLATTDTKRGLPNTNTASYTDTAKVVSYDIAYDEETGLLTNSKSQLPQPKALSSAPEKIKATDEQNDQSGVSVDNSKPRLDNAERQRRIRQSRVTMFAAENFLSFVDFFQMFALIWTVMFRVPWPKEWGDYTSWTLFANLDFSEYLFYLNYTQSLNRTAGTADPHFSMWGELRGWGLLYAGIWAIIVSLLLFLLICIHCTAQSYHANKFWQAPWLQNALQWFFYVVYFPAAVSLLRPFACTFSSFHGKVVMDHDTTQECWLFEFSAEGRHGIVCIILGIIAAILLLYMPAWTISHLKRHIIFDGVERHEFFLEQKQAEYVLGINKDFVTANIVFFSSFKQPGTAFRFLAFLRKFAWVLIYIFVRQNAAMQLGLLWGVQVLWIVTLTSLRPFRVSGSNVVLLILDYTMVVYGLLCLLRGTGINSDAFVDSVFQIILVVVVGCGLFVAILTWMIYGARSRCNPSQYQVQSPDTLALHWIAEIDRVKQTLFNINAKPLELINIDELRTELKSMSACFHEARQMKHILRFTLQDCMEDVQAAVDECESLAMFPNAKLSRVLPSLRAQLDHHAEVHALVAPRSKRWLRKLESMRLFRVGYRGPQSDSDDDFADWEEDAGNETVAELVAQTQSALMPPVNQDAVVALKRQWKARISRWKQEYYRTTGTKPKADDMWQIDEWRRNYVLLKDET